MKQLIDQNWLQEHNAKQEAAVISDYNALAEKLDRSGIKIDTILEQAQQFTVAVPSWGVGTGGTRFARFQAKANHAISSKNLTIARLFNCYHKPRQPCPYIFLGTDQKILANYANTLSNMVCILTQ